MRLIAEGGDVQFLGRLGETAISRRGLEGPNPVQEGKVAHFTIKNS
jgi:hypothetical protein